MTTLPEERRYLSLPAGKRLRLAATCLGGAGALALLALGIARHSMRLEHVFEEHGVLELLHPWLWWLNAVLATVGCWRGGARRDVWFYFWIAFLSMIAGLRELDLHVLLNPDNIHYLGFNREQAVHFRIDWWLSSETGILTRLAWGSIFLILATGFFVPLVLARVRWKRLVLALDAFAWTFGAACGFLGLGYVMDDIILRTMPEAPAWGQRAEEISETVGVALMVCATALALHESHHSRATRVAKRRSDGRSPEVSAGA